MTAMLTAKEMQKLLQVDRSTIYRMAEAGRLPAIKVGRQWRFPSEKVENWLQLQVKAPNLAVPDEDRRSSVERERVEGLDQLLPLECVQLIQDTFADLLGVMLVVTDLNGNPITEPSRACGLFQAVSQVPRAMQKCIESWHSLAQAIDIEPRFSRTHLGLLCARAMIRVGAELKGMVVAGCVAPELWPPEEKDILLMASEFGVEPDLLMPRLNEAYLLSKAQRQLVLDHVQRIADIVAHIVNERQTLVGRLEAIAGLTTFQGA